MEDDKKFLTYADAITFLSDGDRIHTFLNPGAAFLVGTDWDRADILEALSNAKEIEVTGQVAQGMGHGIAVKRQGRTVFIETIRRTDE